jgi:hypothetical protein
MNGISMSSKRDSSPAKPRGVEQLWRGNPDFYMGGAPKSRGSIPE